MTMETISKRSKLMRTEVEKTARCIGDPNQDCGDIFGGGAPMRTTTLKSGAVSKSRFCALAYAPMSEDGRLPAVKHVILLVIEEADRALRFLVHPSLESIVDAIDFPYIKSVLKDFVERINHYAAELFRQLCSLAVGPLQTHAVGERLCEHPDMHKLASQFTLLAN
jgi:hypothetical protein